MPSKPENTIVWNKGTCSGRNHCDWMCLHDDAGPLPDSCSRCTILSHRRPPLSPNSADIPVTINGKNYLCHSGDRLIDVIRAAGIRVPTLCHHPMLPPSGACRLCLVDVSSGGGSRTVTSCDYEVSTGVEVTTDTPRILHHRRVVLEMLLSESPDAPRIQGLAREAGILPAAEPSEARRKLSRSGIPKKNSDCILCGRCVRVCESVTGCGVLEMCGRGSDIRPARAFDADDDPACTKCNACVVVCPTGAMEIPPPTEDAGAACELCMLICPDAAVLKDPVTGEIEINPLHCKRCGLCVHYCPSKALRSGISCDR